MSFEIIGKTEQSSRKSVRSVGIFLILIGCLTVIGAPNCEPLRMFLCGILFCLASTEFVYKWRFLPPLLVLAGMSSCCAGWLRVGLG